MLTAFLEQRYLLVIAHTLIAEIEDVLRRPHIERRLRMNRDFIKLILSTAQDHGIEVYPSGHLRVCRDPKDDFLLEAAILGSVQYVVSRDDDVKRDLDFAVHLSNHGVTVLSVAQFLTMLEQQ